MDDGIAKSSEDYLPRDVRTAVGALPTDLEGVPAPFIGGAQGEFREFIEAFELAQAAGDQEALQRGLGAWNLRLAESQPVIDVTEDGILVQEGAARPGTLREGRALVERAWRELFQENALDRTAMDLATADSAKAARAKASALYSEGRRAKEEAILREAAAGRSAADIARQRGMSDRTVRGIVNRRRS
jgi:hypothetical protein